MTHLDHTADIVVIGAGIAGASVAAELAAFSRVILLEREGQPGYHATGRSAAYFSPAYGNAWVQALTAASENFYKSPPEGFCEAPLIHPRDALHIAPSAHASTLNNAIQNTSRLHPLNVDKALGIVPILRRDYVALAAIETGGGDLDVDAILTAYLRRFKQRGGQLLVHHEVSSIHKSARGFSLDCGETQLSAPIVVNAAGAWADIVAEQAGIAPIGLTPKRRTAFLVTAPNTHDISHWPLLINQADPLYFKPDAGQLLVSPMDETPSPACDAAPDELDIALAIAGLETTTTHKVRRVAHRWAGLRTFAEDETFVVGFDPLAQGFFWLAGQGGYGVQTAPALSRLAASQIHDYLNSGLNADLNSELPADDFERDLINALSPARFRSQPTPR